MVIAHLRPWSGVGVRHIPADSPVGVLDTRYAGFSATNRWNDRGDPTFYIAGDVGVALAEYARHYREERTPQLGRLVTERALYRLTVRVQAVLDLRDAGVRRAIGLQGEAARFLDIAYARATATFVRRTTAAAGLLVPSMAFLDDPSRWNLVLFLDKLPADLSAFFTATYDGVFRVEVA